MEPGVHPFEKLKTPYFTRLHPTVQTVRSQQMLDHLIESVSHPLSPRET
ncbi:uncharacterized protein METZ01_LOCUS429081, partial [marine metagenome]